jgi:hypothetical protein
MDPNGTWAIRDGDPHLLDGDRELDEGAGSHQHDQQASTNRHRSSPAAMTEDPRRRNEQVHRDDQQAEIHQRVVLPVGQDVRVREHHKDERQEQVPDPAHDEERACHYGG